MKRKARFLAGCDEAGRGPLAGPVVCSLVALIYRDDCSFFLNQLKSLGVKDSKQLSAIKRKKILETLHFPWSSFRDGQKFTKEISKDVTLFINTSFISPSCIDQINIHSATMLGMSNCIEKFDKHIKSKTGCVLVDGKFCPENLSLETKALVKGDQKDLLIALSSIVSKVLRDHLMQTYAQIYPQYGFERHVGYPTAFHRKALSRFGPCPFHRKTFRGVQDSL